MANQGLERAIIGELRSRGVSNPDEFAQLDDSAILNTVRWFDAQRGRVGPGVLVAELRKNGRRTKRHRLDEQQAYADEIVAWLRRHFPDLDRPVYGPHPAAVVAVIRLHWRYGKDQLTKDEHGETIQAAVGKWEKQWA
jgi:hypothetical protein